MTDCNKRCVGRADYFLGRPVLMRSTRPITAFSSASLRAASAAIPPRSSSLFLTGLPKACMRFLSSAIRPYSVSGMAKLSRTSLGLRVFSGWASTLAAFACLATFTALAGFSCLAGFSALTGWSTLAVTATALAGVGFTGVFTAGVFTAGLARAAGTMLAGLAAVCAAAMAAWFFSASCSTAGATTGLATLVWAGLAATGLTGADGAFAATGFLVWLMQF